MIEVLNVKVANPSYKKQSKYLIFQLSNGLLRNGTLQDRLRESCKLFE